MVFNQPCQNQLSRFLKDISTLIKFLYKWSSLVISLYLIFFEILYYIMLCQLMSLTNNYFKRKSSWERERERERERETNNYFSSNFLLTFQETLCRLGFSFFGMAAMQRLKDVNLSCFKTFLCLRKTQ